jgi:hypothetical protein
MDDLARRIRVLEDIEAIKKLKARYCYFCDSNYDADGIAGCFVEDGVWDGGEFGRFEGRAAIHEFFAKIAPRMLCFAMHQVMNPLIEINGDRATGRWYIFEPVTFVQDAQAGWLAGRYEDEYVRVGGEWKYQRLRFFQYLSTAFDQPWTNDRFME